MPGRRCLQPLRLYRIRTEIVMTQNKILAQGRHGERGQTIVLVAISILSLLAMASLAVDVVTLYVAKSQIQHAADAAALAGAKAFVESTVTSVPPTDPSYPTLQTIAQNIACPDATCSSGYIGQALIQNPVSGSPAVISSRAYDFTIPGNPRITVSLQRTNLPIFFARIWSSSLASVSATATAEAYNPTPNAVNTSPIPIAPQCVKPILVSNSVPPDFQAAGINTPFVTFATGKTPWPGTTNSGGFIGREVILNFNSSCPPSPPGPKCVPYLRQQVSGPHNFCSTCAGATDYEQSVACCDGTVYDFAQCGDTAETQATANNSPGTGALTQSATQCLIHATGTGPGVGQDALYVTDFLDPLKNDPIQIQAGTYSQSKLGVGANAPISTSDSIITLPIYQTQSSIIFIVGYLQVFVNSTNNSTSNPAGGDLDVTILNVVGCGGATPANPSISGGGISPVPVRLITPP
jgi:hypothetical protein